MAYYKCGKIFVTQNSNTSIETASGAIANFRTSLAMPVLGCDAEFSATQDLHGQSAPYPAGGGKNLLDNVEMRKHSNWKSDLTSNASVPTQFNNPGYKLDLKAGTIYTLSFGISAESYPEYLYLCEDDGTTSTRKAMFTSSSYNTNKFTFTAEEKLYYLRIKSANEENFNEQMSKIAFAQLELGNQATSYAPYENICPIVGVDKVNVVDTGKNFFNPTLTMGERADVNTGEIGQFANSARSEFIEVPFADRKYTFSGLTDELNTYISWYDKDKNYISRSSSNASTEKSGTFPTGSVFAVLSFVKTSGQTADISIVNNLNIQLENSEIATTFEPFGTTALINLGGTYYGGEVDAVTGKITLTHSISDTALSLINWTEDPNRAGVFYGGVPTVLGREAGSDILACSCFKATNIYTTTSDDLYISGKPSYSGSSIFFRNSAWSGKTREEIQSELSGQSIVYQLATPIVVYASNTAELYTKAGLNNIFCDTGDIEVKYRKLHSDN